MSGPSPAPRMAAEDCHDPLRQVQHAVQHAIHPSYPAKTDDPTSSAFSREGNTFQWQSNRIRKAANDATSALRSSVRRATQSLPNFMKRISSTTIKEESRDPMAMAPLRTSDLAPLWALSPPTPPATPTPKIAAEAFAQANHDESPPSKEARRSPLSKSQMTTVQMTTSTIQMTKSQTLDEQTSTSQDPNGQTPERQKLNEPRSEWADAGKADARMSGDPNGQTPERQKLNEPRSEWADAGKADAGMCRDPTGQRPERHAPMGYDAGMGCKAMGYEAMGCEATGDEAKRLKQIYSIHKTVIMVAARIKGDG
jgi:hypothetical protein